MVARPSIQGALVKIDWIRVQELQQEIGEEDFAEVVEMFMEEVDEVIERIRVGVDRTTLEADLHFLNGSALNLGFSEFSNLCQAGETKSAAGAHDSVCMPQILACYEKSRAAFLAECPA